MEIRQICDDSEKQTITRNILEALPEWFGIPEAREEYIQDSRGKCFFAAFDDNAPAGFIYLKQTGKDTVELAVMGVLKDYHRKGIGKEFILIFTEPTTGLHAADIAKVMNILEGIVDRGNTVIVIEHNTDVLKFSNG